MELISKAISIRQPYVELILHGAKRYEYRNRPTTFRGRVLIYAAQQFADSPTAWELLRQQSGPCPTDKGLIVGSVEIVGCYHDATQDRYAYRLADPVRFAAPYKPKGRPQPCFWTPEV